MKAPGAFAMVFAGIASGQEAHLAVTHNQGSNTVIPGHTIRVTATATWTPWAIEPYTFAGLGGDLRATGNAGQAASPWSAFYYEPNPSPLTRLGVPVGGSIVGYDVALLPPHLTNGMGHPEQANWFGVEVLAYDWTAPQVTGPTWIEFSFIPRPLAPNVRLYERLGPVFVEADTTYATARILVLPAPAGGCAVMVAAGWISRRKRHSTGSAHEQEAHEQD